MSIIDVIERARREPPFAEPDDPFPETRYVCKVLDPIAWDRCDVERTLGFEIPPDLATLWDSCGGLILHEDNKFCQWGLVVLAPTEPQFFALNNEYHKDWGGSVLPGDLVIGRFWGDGERPLIRCDKNAADYGSITIVAEMDPRSNWYKAARSLEEFLVGFMDAHGAKYWEYHYQKELAERATQDLLRSRRVN
jgi:hypothetical protein